MGTGDTEREREELRRERIAAEEAERSSGRNRLIIAYAVASTAILALAVGIFVIASGGDGGGADGGESHINLNASIGSTNGVQPDDRAGTVPAAAKTTDLQAAARAAGCKLELGLEDEGHARIPRSSTGGWRSSTPPNFPKRRSWS